jgi:hypothetical protein
VQARPFRLQADLGARLGGDVGHWRSRTCPMSAHGYAITAAIFSHRQRRVQLAANRRS